MKPGSVLVDISIDQGGCFEDSRPTTHAEPTYLVHDSVFYCVANMPGAVPHTSTYALTNVTLPYAVELANRGWRDALRARPRARARPEHARGPADQRAGRRGARLRRGRPGATSLPERPRPSVTDYRQLSLWFDQLAGRSTPRAALHGDTTVDVAIVGAGLHRPLDGVLPARARPGLRIAVLEARDRRLRRVRTQRRLVLGAVSRSASRRWPPRPDATAAIAQYAAMRDTVARGRRVSPAREHIDADIAAGGTVVARAHSTRSCSAHATRRARRPSSDSTSTCSTPTRHAPGSTRPTCSAPPTRRTAPRCNRPSWSAGWPRSSSRAASTIYEQTRRQRVEPASCAPIAAACVRGHRRARDRGLHAAPARASPRLRAGLLADHRHRAAARLASGTRSGCASARPSATSGI